MKKKYLTLITASLLAVSPVASLAATAPQATEVKAATVLTSDQLMKPYYEQMERDLPGSTIGLKITKKTPYLNANNCEMVYKLSKTRITDITSNVGRVTNKGDFNVYPTLDNGMPDYDHILKESDQLKFGQNYVAIIGYDVSGLDRNMNYCYWRPSGNTGDLIWFDVGNGGDYGTDHGPVALILPIHVSNKSARTSKKVPSTKAKKNIKKGYITAKRNHKVRTYTSKGKFSKHYVYGHHSYKFSSKKHIKGHGTCYKISGKNQYVSIKYLLFK